MYKCNSTLISCENFLIFFLEARSILFSLKITSIMEPQLPQAYDLIRIVFITKFIITCLNTLYLPLLVLMIKKLIHD